MLEFQIARISDRPTFLAGSECFITVSGLKKRKISLSKPLEAQILASILFVVNWLVREVLVDSVF